MLRIRIRKDRKGGFMIAAEDKKGIARYRARGEASSPEEVGAFVNEHYTAWKAKRDKLLGKDQPA